MHCFALKYGYRTYAPIAVGIEVSAMRMLGVAGAVLLVALAVLVIRYGHTRFPCSEKVNH